MPVNKASALAVEGRAHGVLNVKRLYLPGVVIRQTCTECGHVLLRDYDGFHANNPLGHGSYLGRPPVNEAFDLPCWCPECDHEWTEPVELRVALVLRGADAGE